MEEKFYKEFEVFSRRRSDLPMEHRFSILAPNLEMAYILAKENFFRRESIHDLWVVERSNIRRMSEEEREGFKRIDNKHYRETKGYADLPKQWRKLEEMLSSEA